MAVMCKTGMPVNRTVWPAAKPLFKILPLVLLALSTTGCVGVLQPYADTGTKPDYKTSTPTLADAREYAATTRENYREVVRNQGALATGASAALIPIAAVGLGAALLGGSRDFLTVYGLAGASFVGVGALLQNKPRVAVYLAGDKALTCAISATEPYLRGEDYVTLRAIGAAGNPLSGSSLRAALAQKASVLAQQISTLPASSQVRVAALERLSLVAPMLDNLQKAESGAASALSTLQGAANRLINAVDEIHNAVLVQVARTEPDIAAVNAGLGAMFPLSFNQTAATLGQIRITGYRTRFESEDTPQTASPPGTPRPETPAEQVARLSQQLTVLNSRRAELAGQAAAAAADVPRSAALQAQLVIVEQQIETVQRSITLARQMAQPAPDPEAPARGALSEFDAAYANASTMAQKAKDAGERYRSVDLSGIKRDCQLAVDESKIGFSHDQPNGIQISKGDRVLVHTFNTSGSDWMWSGTQPPAALGVEKVLSGGRIAYAVTATEDPPTDDPVIYTLTLVDSANRTAQIPVTWKKK